MEEKFKQQKLRYPFHNLNSNKLFPFPNVLQILIGETKTGRNFARFYFSFLELIKFLQAIAEISGFSLISLCNNNSGPLPRYDSSIPTHTMEVL